MTVRSDGCAVSGDMDHVSAIIGVSVSVWAHCSVTLRYRTVEARAAVVVVEGRDGRKN